MTGWQGQQIGPFCLLHDDGGQVRNLVRKATRNYWMWRYLIHVQLFTPQQSSILVGCGM